MIETQVLGALVQAARVDRDDRAAVRIEDFEVAGAPSRTVTRRRASRTGTE